MRKYTGLRAANYNKDRAHNKAFRWQQEVVKKILLRLQPRQVLDAPVGTGRFFEVYQQFPCKVLGIDISPDMLEQAQSIRPENVLLIQTDLFKVEWPEFVVSTRFFGHLKSRENKNRFLSKTQKQLLFSHGPEAYEFIAENNLEVQETYEMGDGKHCITLVERSRSIHPRTH